MVVLSLNSLKTNLYTKKKKKRYAMKSLANLFSISEPKLDYVNYMVDKSKYTQTHTQR